jgi:hypothetical protein
MARMPEAASLQTIRAAVLTIAPGHDAVPDALTLGADRHVVSLIEQALPGFVDLVAALLDAYAREASGSPFAELDDAGRSDVLKRMSSDSSADVRDAADAILLFTYGAVYSEWSSFDRVRRTLKGPASWAATGFPGPAYGHAEYRDDLPPPQPPTMTAGQP